MTAKRAKKLRVVSSGGQHFIEVPSLQAPQLHTYLRSKHVLAEPPVPSFTDVDMIQLGRSVLLFGSREQIAQRLSKLREGNGDGGDCE